MKITLCDLNAKLCAEWERSFRKVNDKINEIEIKCQDIFACGSADGLVSPSNSYLFFDGGIDAVYTKKFGKILQERGQKMVKELPMRELLVGQTLVIPTDNKNIPYVISSPTMRTPLDISDTANPYLAFKASLLTAIERKFESLICPGLGTLTGNVKPEDCASQMFQAYQDVFTKHPYYPSSIREAALAHTNLVGILNIKKKRVTAYG